MPEVDTEKFRLRHFVEKLVQRGECIVHDRPIDLIDIAATADHGHRAYFDKGGTGFGVRLLSEVALGFAG